jgi:hypothetical protein
MSKTNLDAYLPKRVSGEIFLLILPKERILGKNAILLTNP